MQQERDALLERILDYYSRWYDIERYEEPSAPLVASAAFHEHGTGYILVRKAEMWSADRHEYAYFFSLPHLTAELYQACLDKTLELGEPRVDPVSGHMCTSLVTVILCDAADEDALRALKKCRIRKSFQFSLKGWMEIHTAAVEVGKASITANGAARNTAKFLKSVLSPKRKKRGFLK